MSSALDRNADALLQHKALQTSHYERLESELQLTSRKCRLNVIQTKETLADVKRAQQDLTEAQEESRQLENNLVQQQRLRLAMLSAITKELLQKTTDTSKHIEDVQLPWTGIPSRVVKLASEANEAIAYKKSRDDVSICLSMQRAVLSCALDYGALSLVESEVLCLSTSLPSILGSWMTRALSITASEQQTWKQSLVACQTSVTVARDSILMLAREGNAMRSKSEESSHRLDALNGALQCAIVDGEQVRAHLSSASHEHEHLARTAAGAECLVALLSEKIERTRSLVKDTTFQDMCATGHHALQSATSRITSAMQRREDCTAALAEAQTARHLLIVRSVDAIGTAMWLQQRHSNLTVKCIQKREYLQQRRSILTLLQEETTDRNNLLDEFRISVNLAHASFFLVAFQLLVASTDAAAKSIECEEDRHRMGLLDDEMQAVQRTIEDAAHRTAVHEEKERRRWAAERSAAARPAPKTAAVNASQAPKVIDNGTGEPEPRKTVATVIGTNSQVLPPSRRLTVADLRQRALARSPSTESGFSVDYFAPPPLRKGIAPNPVKVHNTATDGANPPAAGTILATRLSGNGGAASRVAMETPSPMPRAPQRTTANHGILPIAGRAPVASKLEVRQPAHLKLGTSGSLGLAAIFGTQPKMAPGQVKGSQFNKPPMSGTSTQQGAPKRPLPPRRNLKDIADNDDDDDFNVFA